MTDQPQYGAAEDPAAAIDGDQSDQPSVASEATDPAHDHSEPAVVRPEVAESSETMAGDRVATVESSARSNERADPTEHAESRAPVAAEPSDGQPAQHGGSGRDGAQATGVPEVDALLGILEDLDVLPLEDHAQVFAEAHQRLHETLLSADEE